MEKPKYNRQDLTKELATENKMRVKVWAKVSERPVRFTNWTHQRRFEISTLAEQIFSVMTDREYIDFLKRINEAQAAKGAQKSMF
jgi:hypothetical protein